MPKLLWFFAAAGLWGQGPLSLRDAVRLSLLKNQSIAAGAASVRAAESRSLQARRGALPKIDYSESFTRSEIRSSCSSLLTQHQFGVENFNIGALNRPDFLNNFQSLLTVDQVLYDAGQTRHAVQSADLAKQITAEEKRRLEMDVIAGATRIYRWAGIVVRNSIILVDFIELRLREGRPVDEAVIDAGAVRFRPMVLTAAAVVVGAGVVLFDPIFQGLAVCSDGGRSSLTRVIANDGSGCLLHGESQEKSSMTV